MQDAETREHRDDRQDRSDVAARETGDVSQADELLISGSIVSAADL
jgi:hypothetical protein